MVGLTVKLLINIFIIKNISIQPSVHSFSSTWKIRHKLNCYSPKMRNKGNILKSPEDKGKSDLCQNDQVTTTCMENVLLILDVFPELNFYVTVKW